MYSWILDTIEFAQSVMHVCPLGEDSPPIWFLAVVAVVLLASVSAVLGELMRALARFAMRCIIVSLKGWGVLP